MRLNTSEIDSFAPATEADLEAKPTWSETFQASYKAMEATGLSTSADNYRYDTFRAQIEDMKKADPDNSNTYDTLLLSSWGNLKTFDVMYNEGGIDNLARYKNSYTAKAYDLYKKKVAELNLKDTQMIENESNLRAKTDYEEAQAVLQDSDYLSAQLAGTAAKGMQDPLTVITLPFGGAAVRGAQTTLKATLQTAANVGAREMAVAAYTEPMIAVAEYNYKQELEIKQSIADSAVNAIAGIAMAGAIRFTGSATIDLTSDGIKALRKVDPDLADEYTTLYKNKITDSDDEHLVNLTRVEEGYDPRVPENPTPEMQEIMRAGPQKEYSFIQPTEPPAKKYEATDIYVGEDAEGKAITKPYKEITEELDTEAQYIKQIEDCLLKGTM